MIDYASVFANRPAGSTYYFPQTQTYAAPATAVSSPTNTALGVTAGQVGGAGYGTPTGAISTGGAGWAGAIQAIVPALTNAASTYLQANAQADAAKAAASAQNQQGAAPQGMIQPTMAQFPLAQIQPAQPIYG